jgi:Calx-beta domain
MRALARTVADDSTRTRCLPVRCLPAVLAVAALIYFPAGAAAHHHHRGAKLTISNVSVHEPNGSASVKAVFNVKLSHSKRHLVKASYETVAGSAGPSDFKAKSGVVRLKRGSRHAHIKVRVMGDNQHEANETFSVKLSHSVHAHMKRRTGVATIIDNDSAGGGGGGGGGGNGGGGGGNGGGGGGNAPDADDDGIPDSLDACPHESDPDGYCPKSVYAVNDGTVGPGSRARVNNLMVTAIDRPDDLAWAQAQPGDAGYQGVKYSALKLVDDAGIPVTLAIGDRVSVSGRTAAGEFDVTGLDIKSSGGTPDVASLTDDNVGNDKYNAVLGSISAETLTTPGSQWTLFSGVGVGKKIISTLPARSAGAYFTTITGISSGTTAAPSLLPRTNADIVDGTAPPRSVATVHITDDCINVGEVGAQIATVRLSGPASSDTTVPASSDDPSAVNLTDAFVPAGTDKGIIAASGVASGSNITVSAALPANLSPVDADAFLDVRDTSVGDTACSTGTN